MTMVFGALVLIEFFKAYNYRSDQRSVFFRPFANRWLNRAVAWELMLLVELIDLPSFQEAFGTVQLPLMVWMILTLHGTHHFSRPRRGNVAGATGRVWRDRLHIVAKMQICVQGDENQGTESLFSGRRIGIGKSKRDALVAFLSSDRRDLVRGVKPVKIR